MQSFLKSFEYLVRVMKLARPYRFRLGVGIACGFLSGLTGSMLMISVKLVIDSVFPTAGAPTLAEQVEQIGASSLAAGDIKDAPGLLAKLAHDTNGLSRLLWSQVPAAMQQALQAPTTTDAQRQDALAVLLTSSLTNGPLYSPERFAGLRLSSEARRLIAQAPADGDELARLNRLLLSAAYPAEIGKPKSSFTRAIVLRVAPVLRRLDPHSSRLLTLLLIATIPLSMLLRGVMSYLNIYLMNWVSIRAIMDLREKLFAHLLSLSAAFFNRFSTGELMSRFTEVQVLQGTISNSLVVIIRDPITVISLLAYLVSQQPRLTLIAIVVFPVTLIPFVVYSKKVRRSSGKMYQQYADMGKLLHETFTGYRVVRAYNLEGKMVEEFRSSSHTAIGFFMRMLRSSELPGPLIEFFGALGVAAFLIYLSQLHDRTPGNLLSFIGSIFLMYAPIKNILKLHAQLEQANAASSFLFDMLETRTTVPEPANPIPLRATGKSIHFDRVGFAYGDRPVLQDFELTVQPGQLVALVGSSGAGKTTVTSLLLRFYDPTQGAIRIGDTDIREVATAELRSQIAVVTQETILFNDTIRANVALGRPGASDADIEAAVRAAHAWDFVQDKPQGLDTVVGEKGVMLSGGQRQRLAIARAILKQAPILVLDEATNALDTESERAVQAALDDFMQGRTTLCIAHRLSTIHHADVIVVMDQGRIVETGRHDELIQCGGVYQRLYEMQFCR